MTAFAGFVITCFAAFSRVTRLAFAKELLVCISKKTLSIVQARFVYTNILVKKKRNLDFMTFYYYFVDFEQFPFQSVDSCVESRLGRARESEPAEKGTGGFSLTAKNPAVLQSSYVIEPLDTSDDIKVATIFAVEGTIIQINPFTARVNKLRVV